MKRLIFRILVLGIFLSPLGWAEEVQTLSPPPKAVEKPSDVDLKNLSLDQLKNLHQKLKQIEEQKIKEHEAKVKKTGVVVRPKRDRSPGTTCSQYSEEINRLQGLILSIEAILEEVERSKPVSPNKEEQATSEQFMEALTGVTALKSLSALGELRKLREAMQSQGANRDFRGRR